LSTNPHEDQLTHRLQNIQEQFRRKQAALKSDPEGYVRRWVSDVHKGWEKVAKNPDDLDLLHKTKELSRQAQLARGVDAKNVRVLPDFMADAYLKAATRPGGSTAIAQIRDALGEDYKEFLEQASRKAGPLVNVAVMLDRPQQREAQEKLLAINGNGGIAALEAALPKKYSPRGILDRVRTELRELAPSFAAQPGGVQVFARIETSVYAMTLDCMETQHMEPGQAAERAAREIATGFYQPRSFNGRAYRVPLGYDADVIAKMLPKYTVEAIDYSKVDRPANLQSLPAELIKLALVYNGYWTTRGDEQGVYLRTPGGALVTIQGKPITVMWQDLLQAALIPHQSEQSPPR